jgi:hypothetical protein
MKQDGHGWGFVPVLLVPLACCALPLVLGAGIALGAIAVGGTVVAALVVGVGTGIVIVRCRRRDRSDAPIDAVASRTGR